MTEAQISPALVRITTVSGSCYEVDLEGRRLRRIPAAAPQVGPAGSVDLRRDGMWIALVAGPSRLEVGEPAVFVLQPLGGPDAVATIRTTTPIVAVERIEAAE